VREKGTVKWFNGARDMGLSSAPRKDVFVQFLRHPGERVIAR